MASLTLCEGCERPANQAQIDALKTRLNVAFKQMRKDGLLARQNYLCCSGCAGSAITEEAIKRIRSGHDVMGCVFYHQQDAHDFRSGKDFYLAFGDMNSSDLGKIGLPTKTVGDMVTKRLAEIGIKYEWDGNPETRIKVLLRGQLYVDIVV